MKATSEANEFVNKIRNGLILPHRHRYDLWSSVINDVVCARPSSAFLITVLVPFPCFILNVLLYLDGAADVGSTRGGDGVRGEPYMLPF